MSDEQVNDSPLWSAPLLNLNLSVHQVHFPGFLEERASSNTCIFQNLASPAMCGEWSSIEPLEEGQDSSQNLVASGLHGDTTLQKLVEATLAQGNALRELVEIGEQQDKSLQNIAQPNIADWMGTGANVAVALLAVYAAVKVRNVFEDRQDDKVYAELEKLWEICDEVSQGLNMYSLLFPFRLLEPVEEWNENEEIKKKVEGSLNFSDGQSEKMKHFLNALKSFKRTIHRLGWKIHPKSLSGFDSLLESVEAMYRSLGNYNCYTAQLFRIDKQFIGMSMFLGFENLEWDERFSAIDQNLVDCIGSVNNLKDRVIENIALLEALGAKNKFVSKRRLTSR